MYQIGSELCPKKGNLPWPGRRRAGATDLTSPLPHDYPQTAEMAMPESPPQKRRAKCFRLEDDRTIANSPSPCSCCTRTSTKEQAGPTETSPASEPAKKHTSAAGQPRPASVSRQRDPATSLQEVNTGYRPHTPTTACMPPHDTPRSSSKGHRKAAPTKARTAHMRKQTKHAATR